MMGGNGQLEDILRDQAAWHASLGNNTSDQLAGALHNYFGLQHGQSEATTAQAHLDQANPLKQYQTPFGVKAFAAANQLTPEQEGGMAQAAGLGPPGGPADAGYYQAQYPQLQQPPGAEPRSAADTMALMDGLRRRDPLAAHRAMLSQHTQDEYKATGQPSYWDILKNHFGFSGGYDEALGNRSRYQQTFED